jgi:hypothetical protein
LFLRERWHAAPLQFLATDENWTARWVFVLTDLCERFCSTTFSARYFASSSRLKFYLRGKCVYCSLWKPKIGRTKIHKIGRTKIHAPKERHEEIKTEAGYWKIFFSTSK